MLIALQVVTSFPGFWIYSCTECNTGLAWAFFLNKNVKSDFVVLKNESGINFLLIPILIRQSSKPLQLTIFILLCYELPGPCISFFPEAPHLSGQYDQ